MKFLSTFKITKGFDTWLKMYKEIEPDLNELGIKILWAGTNSDETKVFDITEVKDPSKFEVLVKREDITKKRADAGVELESQEVIETISKEYLGLRFCFFWSKESTMEISEKIDRLSDALALTDSKMNAIYTMFLFISKKI